MKTWAKRAVLLAGFAATLGAVSPAGAVVVGPINTGSYTGPVEMHYSGFTTEANLTAGTNETTWGAAYVDQIYELGNSLNTFYNGAASASKIAAVIYGIADGNILPGGFNGTQIYNIGCTGGPCDGNIHIDFYLVPTGSAGSFTDTTAAGLAVGDRTGFDTFTGITDVGALFMKWELVPGIYGSNPAGGSNGAFDETNTTLYQDVNSATLPATGSGRFYADCVSGPACTYFDNNAYPNGGDFFARYTLSSLIPAGASINGWEGRVSDPVETSIQVPVPEPGTLSLFGISLLGLGFASKRKAKKSA